MNVERTRRPTSDAPDQHPWSVAFVFVVLLLAHCYFLNEYPRFRNPNTYSRLYLTLAIVEEGSFRVDHQVERYGLVQDLARYKGHYFTDKAPGSSMLLAPAAWVLRHTIIPPSIRPPSYDATNMSVALRLLGVSIPTVLFWFFTRRTWYELAGGVERGLAVILAGALGTSFFIYATQLFAHVPAAILAFVGFLCIRAAANVSLVDRRREAARIAVAGFCVGLAFITDYILLLAVPVFAGYAILCRPRDRWIRLAAWVAGALPPTLVGLSYNYACFENPLSVGFHYHVDPGWGAGYRSGFFGIQAPDWSALVGATLLPQRGVMYLAPVLLLAPIGWYRQLRRRESRGEAVAAMLTVATIVLFATTTLDWKGGWSVGARYLVATIPFLLLGVAVAIRPVAAESSVSVAFRALAPVGIVMISLAAASFPCFPDLFENPVWQLVFPMIQAGQLMPNLLGAHGLVDDLLIFAVIVGAAIAFVVWRSWPASTKGGRKAVAVAVGLSVALLVIFQQLARPADSIRYQDARQDVLDRMGY